MSGGAGRGELQAEEGAGEEGKGGEHGQSEHTQYWFP